MTTSLIAQTILITAATSSLGQGIAQKLASQNVNMILTGRNLQKLECLKKNILTQYPEMSVELLTVDFSDIESMKQEIALKMHRQIDGIVLIGPRPVLNGPGIPQAHEWSIALHQTFIAPLEFLRLILPNVNEGGSLVILSGHTSKQYFHTYPHTNVIRLAWSAELKNLVDLLSQQKIRANIISPGPVLTDFHHDRIQKKAEKNGRSFEEQFECDVAHIPLKTYGSVEDVAELAYFLLSEKSKHINGVNIALDGGETQAYS